MTRAYPEYRRRIRRAAVDLSDRARQHHGWLRGEPAATHDSFGDTVLFLIDELEVWSDHDIVGGILDTDQAAAAFIHLRTAVAQAAHRIEFDDFGAALALGSDWDEVVAAATVLRVAIDHECTTELIRVVRSLAALLDGHDQANRRIWLALHLLTLETARHGTDEWVASCRALHGIVHGMGGRVDLWLQDEQSRATLHRLTHDLAELTADI